MSKELIVVVGPTASGKTSLSVELAKKFKTEIISADSRQFYKEMSIGTAKPTIEEQDGIVHHFIDSHSINEVVSAGRFEREGLAILDQLFQTNDTVICVGGSGLFINALCDGLDDIPKDEKIRIELTEIVAEFGLNPLLKELEEKDIEFFNKIDKSNTQRVIRAVEVLRVTGSKYSDLRTSVKKSRPFKITKIGIEHSREVLYDRINRRVDLMMQAGLLDEVKSLIEYRSHNALQTVGYKELFEYLDGSVALETAVELIKRNTRRYAKRQLTWFRKDESTRWIAYDNLKSLYQ